MAATYVEVWEGVAGVLSELDALAGLAEAAACAPVQYVRPDMLEGGEGQVVLRGCRHPNVEVQVREIITPTCLHSLPVHSL